MKTFVLAALAALSLGVAVASAAPATRHDNWPTVTQWGPPDNGAATGG